MTALKRCEPLNWVYLAAKRIDPLVKKEGCRIEKNRFWNLHRNLSTVQFPKQIANNWKIKEVPVGKCYVL